MTHDAELPSTEAAQRASGSSFYSAMRIMRRPQRQAMFEIYAFCRAVDDIADDGQDESEARLEQLQRWHADIDAVYAGRPPSNLEPTLDSVYTPHHGGSL